MIPTAVHAAEPAIIQAERLIKAGQELAQESHYIEALDLLDQAKSILESAGMTRTALYAEVLYSLAETDIKGRLYQGFPAGYVKAGLRDVQAANKLREQLPDILPQTLARGYYLEGFILKRFFRRTKEASSCFVKAVQIDPSCAAAKRELSEIIDVEEPK